MHDMPCSNPWLEFRPPHAEVVVDDTMQTVNQRAANSRATNLACSGLLRIALEQDMRRQRSLRMCVLPCVLLLALAVSAGAQGAPQAVEGIDSGNYNIRQTIEFGYRSTDVSGNPANYNTFVNLNSGVRLFEQSLDVRSLNHAGFLFDNLSMHSFGYGGDPNDVTRLRVSKNKWYDFNGSFRRDRYPWNYNLLANPLNPITSVPVLPITNSPHSMNVVRRMSDFNLTLLPQSRIRFRLGYTRNIQEGPSTSTFGGATLLDPMSGYGTQTQLFQNWKTTLNAYHLGADFQVLRKTTIHYDQVFQYFKQDTSYADKNLNYQLSNGVPVDLGIVFDTASNVNTVPCLSPVANSGTTPQTADPSCNAYLSYSRVGRPRSSLPTEQLGFQSESIKNVAMSGRAAYSSGEQNSHDLNEVFTGSNVSTLQVGTNATGPTRAKRVIANADWAATWSVTSNFRVVDSFTYDRFQLPGSWDFSTISLYAQAPLINGGPSLLLPPGRFDPTNCPPPFTANTCPQHNDNSGPDVTSGAWIRYLGQNLRSNTLQLEYDLSSKFGARLGYRYGNRKVFSQDTESLASEVFFPGGVGAARGDCSDPTGCTQQPDGSLVFTGSFGDTSHVQDADITSHSMLSGLWARPTSNLRLNFDWELFWADSAFVRSDPRQQQRYRFQAAYTASRWLSLDASFDILEHRNGMLYVNDREHDRGFTLTAVVTPNERFSVDLGYSYNNVYAQLIECWAYGAGVAPPVAPGLLPSGAITTPCPVPGELQGGDVTAFGGSALYSSNTHFAYGDVSWKPINRLMLRAGYAGSFANGNTLFLNPNAPVGPLQYAYQKPYAGFVFDLAKGFAFKTTWAYYGYNPRSIANPAGLAPIGSQDFNANNVTLALRYSF
jgi:hypothetical protein